MTALAPTLQAFFTDRLTRQRNASPNTIAGYRDTWRMLLAYAAARTGTAPSMMDLDDLDASLVAAFLDHLERERGNSIRTRNTRLAAIHSLFRYAALIHPEHAQSISRVLAIPPKRFDRALVSYLTDDEVDALLAACDQTTWTGRRDHAMLLIAVQTGLRISELIGLTPADLHLGTGAHVVCHGKGRKERATPLTAGTRVALRAWLNEHLAEPNAPLFPSRQGRSLSRDAIERRISHYALLAAERCPSLNDKTVTAHVLRHTTGTRLINRDVPQEVVRKILDHDSHVMTGHYARLSDTTIRRHWERAHKVNASGQTLRLNPEGPLAEASWAKQRVGRATQALPNGYCGLPVQKSCPHANACLTCPMFITTGEFLPQHRTHRDELHQIISAAEAHGQRRLVEMNQQVANNLDKIIATLEEDCTDEQGEAADAH